MPIDRSNYPTRKITLADEGTQSDVSHLTCAERIEMVEILSEQAWAFAPKVADESRFLRHIERIDRRGR